MWSTSQNNAPLGSLYGRVEVAQTPPSIATGITTGADSVLGLCGELSGKLYAFIVETDESVGGDTLLNLRSEVNSLAVVTGSLKQNFIDPLVSAKLLDVRNASLQAHWVALTPCFTYCWTTLNSVNNILKTVEYCEGRYLINPITNIKLDLKTGQIPLLTQQTTAFRQTFNVSLSLIAAYLLVCDITHYLAIP
jgi:hypothetical protein